MTQEYSSNKAFCCAGILDYRRKGSRRSAALMPLHIKLCLSPPGLVCHCKKITSEASFLFLSFRKIKYNGASFIKTILNLIL